ncbi:DNA-3-methyladenine glycosylase I [Rothia terrae]|uniref:DNA-3-methyladenine glycosylase I n=1 Tax=Rothia terrae TaxID=396015 RepID=A0A7H2BG68_9MICC|nr:DNA-3-methyladenine glycosylase I [Rothia terrae]QNV38664.1 DNA-3-methyladenine glycosylase I [Rothia terrae]
MTTFEPQEITDDAVPSWVKDERTDLYFRNEWGTVPLTQHKIFEHLCLLTFQLGLQWKVVLKHRKALAKHLKDFDPAHMATLTDADIDSLLLEPSMIRNRRKIEACVHNAKMLMYHEIDLPEVLSEHFGKTIVLDTSAHGMPRTYPATDELSNFFKDCEMQLVGPVLCCALAQATGYIRPQKG